MGHAESVLARGSRTLAMMVVFAAPLVAWPGMELPFSTPKLWVLCVGTATLLILAAARRAVGPAWRDTPVWLRAAGFVWMASFAWSGALAPYVARDALLLGLAGPLLAFALVAGGSLSASLVRATLAAATVLALIVVAQWAGHDPFAAAGWAPAIQGASDRLRTYGTLGNPNFVAAWLSMAAPFGLALAWRARVTRRHADAMAAGAVFAVCVVALAMTGSRGGALGLVVGLGTFVLLVPGSGGRAARRTAGVAGVVVVAASLVWLSTARPLAETLAGRVYIWRIVASHAFDRPVAGWGPGAFELVYHDWQGTAPTHESDRVFAGPQQRAHNDYLEALVERGVAGLAATVLLAGVVLASAIRWRRRGAGSEFTAAAAASVCAVGAVAFVDFPLARPAEIAALWAAVAVLTLETKDAS
jgi:O-antigen ligase